MKPLSETLTELGIDFTFPINIQDENENRTYFENSNGYWSKSEYDENGNRNYYEDSGNEWYRVELDENGNETYFENGYGVKVGTPRSAKTHEGKVVEVDGVKYTLKAL